MKNEATFSFLNRILKNLCIKRNYFQERFAKLREMAMKTNAKAAMNSTFDKSAFEQVFKSHFVHLCNFAAQFVPDMDTARDITQKVFIQLWENREKIDPNQSIRSYLFTSVKNRCLNYIRDQKKYRSKVLDVDIQSVDVAFEEDQFAVEELQNKIDRALSRLPEKCRKVFELSRYENKKYQERI